MIPVSQVVNGALAYAEAEILPSMEGLQLWMGGATLILLSKQITNVVASFAASKAATMLGLADDKGNVDVEAAADALKQSAQRHGKITVELPVFGTFKFGDTDVDALKMYIMEASA